MMMQEDQLILYKDFDQPTLRFMAKKNNFGSNLYFLDQNKYELKTSFECPKTMTDGEDLFDGPWTEYTMDSTPSFEIRDDDVEDKSKEDALDDDVKQAAIDDDKLYPCWDRDAEEDDTAFMVCGRHLLKKPVDEINLKYGCRWCDMIMFSSDEDSDIIMEEPDSTLEALKPTWGDVDPENDLVDLCGYHSKDLTWKRVNEVGVSGCYLCKQLYGYDKEKDMDTDVSGKKRTWGSGESVHVVSSGRKGGKHTFAVVVRFWRDVPHHQAQ